MRSGLFQRIFGAFLAAMLATVLIFTGVMATVLQQERQVAYENEVRQTEYDGFTFVKAVESEAVLTLEGQAVQDLFAMTPYYWNTPANGAARLAACGSLTTEIGFRFLVYQKM